MNTQILDTLYKNYKKRMKKEGWTCCSRAEFSLMIEFCVLELAVVLGVGDV